MPMFTFLSGYVYAWRPFAGNGKQFMGGKVRRLLLPMLVVGTAFAFVQSVAPGVNAVPVRWATLHIVPVAHYWFLESLFVIFIATIILEWLNLLANPGSFTAVAVIAVILHLTIAPTIKFGLSGANYLFPYFLYGLYCSRFAFGGARYLPISVAILLATSVYAVAGVIGFIPVTPLSSVVGLLLGVSACSTVMWSGWESRTLAYIGLYSYTIYLLHVFFTASVRVFEYSMNFRNVTELVIVATAAGIVGPILIEKIADRSALTRTALLGKAWLTPARALPG